MSTALTCFNCGESVRTTDRFCSRCGAEQALGSYAAALPQDYSHPDDDPESPWAEVVQRLRRATFGEFEIGPELGRGGMAAVFLAHDVSLDRQVAIKVMSPGLLMGEGMIERFKREAITIAHLNHPNIVSCYSVRQAEGLHFFVMRYIQGRSLEQVIRDAGKLPISIVRSILCQVGSALTYAHRSSVVHRDVKPANILIDVDGNAVVTDFGIAKVAALPGHTHTGALVGTPAYMSPEQCAGGPVTGAADQYALGAVAYEMITGQAPFTGSSLTVMQAQVEVPPAPIRDRCPDCPPDLEAAILRMLAKDPAARFPSMAEAKAALGATPLTENDPLLAELCRLASVSSPPSESEGSAGWTGGAPPKRSVARSAAGGPARSISVLPPPAELAVGEAFALVALVRGERGVPLPGRAVEWSTDSPDVLHVDQTRKTATAVAPGTAMLTASSDGIEAQVRVLVPPDVLEPVELQPDYRAAAIQLSSPPKSIRAGDSFVLTAMPLDHAGHPLADAAVLWSTSDVRVAVVTAGGWVAALGRGQAVLTATCGLASGSVTIYVEQAKPAVPPPRRSPLALPTEPQPVPDHRSSWRRRGARARRRALAAGVGVLVAGGTVWLFGGLHNFPSVGARQALVADTIPGLNAALAAATRPDSIPPINRGAGAAAAARPASRPVRAPNTGSPSPSAGSRLDSGRVAARVAADRGSNATTPSSATAAPPAGAAPRRLQAAVPLSGRVGDPPAPAVAAPRDTGDALPPDAVQLAVADTGNAPGVGNPRPDAAGYVPMSSPDAEAVRPAPARPATRTSSRPAATGARAPDRAELSREERKRLEDRMRDGVEACYRAVRSKDVSRVARLYDPQTVADEDKLRRLIRILRTEPWEATIGRRVDGARELGPRAAAAEFSFRLAWRDAFGGRLSSQPIFRAEFSRDGDDWTMSSCRIVGSPKL
ncbi:MAG TPA: protein kinase [Gemmatimonadales bacterium]|nr:protein kinase [Gemmatimonadales bacterium]